MDRNCYTPTFILISLVGLVSCATLIIGIIDGSFLSSLAIFLFFLWIIVIILSLMCSRNFYRFKSTLKSGIQILDESNTPERELQQRSGFIVLNENHEIVDLDMQAVRILGYKSPVELKKELPSTEYYPKLLQLDQNQYLQHSITIDNHSSQTLFIVSINHHNTHTLYTYTIISLPEKCIHQEYERNSLQRISRELTHELTNSIAPISSLSNALKDETDVAELHRGLDVIHQTSLHLVSLINYYKSYAQLPDPDLKSFSIFSFFNQIKILLTNEIPKPIEFSTENYLAHDREILIDKGQITQVIINIVKNSIHSLNLCEQDCYIKLKFREVNDHRFQIDIINNGDQIKKKNFETIFTPFFSTKLQGTGIGLSVSRQIMQNHGGDLILSYSTEHETCFSMIF